MYMLLINLTNKYLMNVLYVRNTFIITSNTHFYKMQKLMIIVRIKYSIYVT